MQRTQRASIAQETLDIVERGEYRAPSGTVVRIADDVARSCAGTRLFRPSDFPEDLLANLASDGRAGGTTHVEVTAETTLQAARRLVTEGGKRNLLCLNFASARNPGGGFLGGSQAQEESLARSSALYASIAGSPMYEHNRQEPSLLYSDHMIYSPLVPVFRDDDGALLETPYHVAFLTAPAVNAGAVRSNQPENAPLIAPTMARRLHRLLWLAHTTGHLDIVLGAGGCGVFGNDPTEIAAMFRAALGVGGDYRAAFDTIVYAVYDRSADRQVLAAFESALQEQ